MFISDVISHFAVNDRILKPYYMRLFCYWNKARKVKKKTLFLFLFAEYATNKLVQMRNRAKNLQQAFGNCSSKSFHHCCFYWKWNLDKTVKINQLFLNYTVSKKLRIFVAVFLEVSASLRKKTKKALLAGYKRIVMTVIYL